MSAHLLLLLVLLNHFSGMGRTEKINTVEGEGDVIHGGFPRRHSDKTGEMKVVFKCVYL